MSLHITAEWRAEENRYQLTLNLRGRVASGQFTPHEWSKTEGRIAATGLLRLHGTSYYLDVNERAQVAAAMQQAVQCHNPKE